MPPGEITLPEDYGENIDFKALKKFDEEFQQTLSDNDGRLDWQNPKHLM